MILNLLFNEMFPSILQSSINAGAFAMLGGMIIVPVVSLLTPKLDRELVDSCFSWYEEPVTVAAKFSLSDKELRNIFIYYGFFCIISNRKYTLII